MSKFDDIKMPDNIDEVTKNAIRRGKTKKYQYKKVTKVAASIAVISTLTITTTFAVEYIIDYFNHNKQSLYLSDKNDFEKTSNNINLTVKDKGIEFTIDNISIDDNYITGFSYI